MRGAAMRRPSRIRRWVKRVGATLSLLLFVGSATSLICTLRYSKEIGSTHWFYHADPSDAYPFYNSTGTRIDPTTHHIRFGITSGAIYLYEFPGPIGPLFKRMHHVDFQPSLPTLPLFYFSSNARVNRI